MRNHFGRARVVDEYVKVSVVFDHRRHESLAVGRLGDVALVARAVAFLLSGEMAVGYFRTHAPRGLWPLTNGGELAVFYCFFYLWLSSAGAGSWSLDRLLGRKTCTATAARGI